MTRKVKVFSYVFCLPDGKYTKAFIQFGKFHSFGLGCIEHDNGVSSFSSAIVELKDGSVINIECTLIEFVGKENSND